LCLSHEALFFSPTTTADEDEMRELRDIMEDVRGYLRKRDGLPKYVQRTDLVRELNKAAGDHRMRPEERAEAIDLTWSLIDTAKSRKEAQHCLELALPSVTAHLGAAREDPQRGEPRKRSAVRFLQKVLQADEGHEVLLVEAFGRYGVNAKSDAVSIEAMRLLPELVRQEGLKPADRRDITGPLVVSLYEQLDQPKRENKAFLALIHFRELIGEDNFKEDSQDASLPDQEIFRTLERGHEEQHNFDFNKKRPRDGTSFGIIPNRVLNECLNKGNRSERPKGAEKVVKILRRTDDEEFAVLLPYMPAFLKFLARLLNDSNPNVVLNGLASHDVLLKRAPDALKLHTDAVTDNLMDVSLETTLQVRTEVYRLMKEHMLACGPQKVVDTLVDELDNKNPKVIIDRFESEKR